MVELITMRYSICQKSMGVRIAIRCLHDRKAHQGRFLMFIKCLKYVPEAEIVVSWENISRDISLQAFSFPLSLPKFPSTESRHAARRTQTPNWSSHLYVTLIWILGSQLNQRGHTILPLLCASSQRETSVTEQQSEIENCLLNRLTLKIFPQTTGLQLEW